MQLKTIWESPSANKDTIERLFSDNQVKTDILILPEMFTTGFSMEPEKLAEDMQGPTVDWMQEKAKDWSCILTGSIIINSQGNYMNRLLWVAPSGLVLYYDKKHLFRMGEENEHYTSGREILLTKLNEWRFRPLICYDLRFPVWSRNRSDYDVLIYVANWPESRREVWKSLLVARALENQAYAVGVNRIGKDGRDISYSGDSLVIDPRGQIISRTKSNIEAVETLSIPLDELQDFREKFPVHLDADEFTIQS